MQLLDSHLTLIYLVILIKNGKLSLVFWLWVVVKVIYIMSNYRSICDQEALCALYREKSKQ
jgi:hypothetical protein